jgi:chromosome segregation ATPase
VREQLGNVGSMGTINKLLQQCLGNNVDAPGSLRQLPPGLQQAILGFADQETDRARKHVAEELVQCRQEMAGLADENERLGTAVEDLREQSAGSMSERAAIEGRSAQLANELASAREETAAERLAVLAARTELARLQARVEALAPLEAGLRDVRVQFDAEREARARSEQASAVLGAQKQALEHHVQELKDALANARDANDRFDAKIRDLSELLDTERQARAVAERELAVAAAAFNGKPRPGKRGQKEAGTTGDVVPG